MKRLTSQLGWAALSLVGAVSLAYVALKRGETINAVWVVMAAVCVYLIAYRFYSLYIADKVMGLDARRQTPAYKYNDGLDYVPTNRYVLFGHHFAAIAGAGPLVGPVLAAQMGYLPGMLWILAGVVFAGAVQDFMVLFLSMRRDGRSLGEMIRTEMGNGAGPIPMIGSLMIMSILPAVLAATCCGTATRVRARPRSTSSTRTTSGRRAPRACPRASSTAATCCGTRSCPSSRSSACRRACCSPARC